MYVPLEFPGRRASNKKNGSFFLLLRCLLLITYLALHAAVHIDAVTVIKRHRLGWGTEKDNVSCTREHKILSLFFLSREPVPHSSISASGITLLVVRTIIVCTAREASTHACRSWFESPASHRQRIH